jgi:hypothetical protein
MECTSFLINPRLSEVTLLWYAREQIVVLHRKQEFSIEEVEHR